MPRVPSQRVQYHFKGKPFFACFGPTIDHFRGTPTCAQNGPNQAHVASKRAKSSAFRGAKRVKTGPGQPKYAPHTFPEGVGIIFGPNYLFWFWHFCAKKNSHKWPKTGANGRRTEPSRVLRCPNCTHTSPIFRLLGGCQGGWLKLVWFLCTGFGSVQISLFYPFHIHRPDRMQTQNQRWGHGALQDHVPMECVGAALFLERDWALPCPFGRGPGRHTNPIKNKYINANTCKITPPFPP